MSSVESSRGARREAALNGSLDRAAVHPSNATVSRRTIATNTVAKLRLALLWVVAGMAPGCTMFDAPLASLGFLDEDAPRMPTKVIPVWTETVLHQAGQQNIRGCGGRIVFYGRDNERPIRVDGSIVVYAWDDTDETKSRSTPDRKYVFTAEMLQKHYSQSRVGHSYSLWIPWDEVGNPHRKVTLITRFIGARGGEVTSSPAKVIIPGPIAQPANEAYESDLAKRDAGHQPSDLMLATHESESSQDGLLQLIHQSQTSEAELPAETSKPQLDLRELELQDTSTIDLSPGFVERNLSRLNYLDLDALEPGGTVELQTSHGLSRDSQSENLPAADRGPESKSGGSDSSASEAEAPELQEPAERLQSRYERSRFPARTASSARPGGDPIRREPIRAAWLNGLSPTPRHLPTSRSRQTAQDASESRMTSPHRQLD